MEVNWVAVGDGTDPILWSSDGMKWNPSSLPIGGGGFYGDGVACGTDYSGNPLWVAVGGVGIGGSVTILWSPNGTSWYLADNGFSGYEKYGNKVAFGHSPSGPLWVTVGYGVNTILWSENGKSWTPAINGFGPYIVGYDVSFGYSPSGDPLWVAVGEGADKILWSPDGKTWTPANRSDTMYGIAFGYSYFGSPLWMGVGVGSVNPLTIFSSDGMTWRKASTISSVIGLAYGTDNDSPLWMAVGFGIIAFAQSPNDAWTDGFGIQSNTRSVAYDGSGTWIAVGNGGILRSTTGGKYWEDIHAGFSGYGVAHRRMSPRQFTPLPCFLKGTRILTKFGYKRIEELESGDLLLTADKRTAKAIVYTYQIQATSDSAPYRIPAGSLGSYIPSRDLHISGNHAIKDGYGLWQIPRFLAQKNPTIQQHSLGETVTYYHIESPKSVKFNVIAEGVTVESTKSGKVFKRTDRNRIHK